MSLSLKCFRMSLPVSSSCDVRQKIVRPSVRLVSVVNLTGLADGSFTVQLLAAVPVRVSARHSWRSVRDYELLAVIRLTQHTISGFGGIGIACWPLVPKFVGSNPAEAVGFLGRKILSTPSFGGEVKPSVPCRRFAACKRALNLRGSRNLGKITGQFLAHSSTFRC